MQEKILMKVNSHKSLHYSSDKASPELNNRINQLRNSLEQLRNSVDSVEDIARPLDLQQAKIVDLRQRIAVKNEFFKRFKGQSGGAGETANCGTTTGGAVGTSTNPSANQQQQSTASTGIRRE